nr:dynamin family protein [Campylobacter sp.]
MQLPVKFEKLRNAVDKFGNFCIPFKTALIKMEVKKQVSELENFINEMIELEKKYEDISIRNDLVAKIISAKLKNDSLAKFKHILNNDFVDFANADGTLANEAEMVLVLQGVEKELEIIASNPNLYNKTIIAVGGGFSAGKSKFISSFMQDKMYALPTSIEPTTAIPTYIMNAKKQGIQGYNKNGGMINLDDLSDNMHLKLSHQFIKSFNFNLKEILPFIVINTKLNYDKICFIDTPGYNPATSVESYGGDLEAAKEFLDNAGIFLWLISCDNGTIPKSDLDFLEELDLQDKKLFVVINKADLKSLTDLKDIAQNVQESLDDYEINYEGISCYSAVKNEEYHFIKQSLLEFLSTCNVESMRYTPIFDKIAYVYLSYKDAMLKSIEEKNIIKNALNSVSLDVLEEGIDDTNDIQERITSIKSNFNILEEKQNLKLLDKVADDMFNAVKGIFEENGIKVKFRDYKNTQTPLQKELKEKAKNRKKAEKEAQAIKEERKIQEQQWYEKYLEYIKNLPDYFEIIKLLEEGNRDDLYKAVEAITSES